LRIQEDFSANARILSEIDIILLFHWIWFKLLFPFLEILIGNIDLFHLFFGNAAELFA